MPDPRAAHPETNCTSGPTQQREPITAAPTPAQLCLPKLTTSVGYTPHRGTESTTLPEQYAIGRLAQAGGCERRDGSLLSTPPASRGAGQTFSGGSAITVPRHWIGCVLSDERRRWGCHWRISVSSSGSIASVPVGPSGSAGAASGAHRDEAQGADDSARCVGCTGSRMRRARRIELSDPDALVIRHRNHPGVAQTQFTIRERSSRLPPSVRGLRHNDRKRIAFVGGFGGFAG